MNYYEKMKNPFKKSSIVNTVVNVGIGGAANVAMDYVYANVDALASLGENTKNAIKIAAGAIAGSMVSNQYARAAADGIATVGAANLIASYITPETADTTAADAAAASGLPSGTIGRIRMGQRGFRRGRVAGVGANPSSFMSE